MRAFVSSVTQRPCGIIPPFATVAATRAIWNGDATTCPWPYDDCGSDFFSCAAVFGDAAAMPSRFAVSNSGSAPDIVRPQLREVRIAGDHDAVLHIDGAVRRLVLHVVADRPVRAFDEVARRARPAAARTHTSCCASCGFLRSAAIAVTTLNVEPGGYSP